MQTISFFTHAPEFHVPKNNDDSKAEVKPVENNSVDKKPENKMQKTSAPEVETQVETVVEQKVINSVDLPQTNIFMPQAGEIVVLLLLTMPFLLFSIKRYIFR